LSDRRAAPILPGMSIRPEPIPGFPAARLARVPLEEAGLDRLHPDEQAWIRGRKSRRITELVAGRAALRAALTSVGWSGEGALLQAAGGGPALPAGFTGSITHKAGFALAVAAPLRDGRTLGLDCEVLGARERLSIATRVLRSDEHARWQARGGGWRALLEVFSVKEAIYKALYPHVPRYIGFEEAEIQADGGIRMRLKQGEGDYSLRSSVAWESDRLVAVVEVAPASSSHGSRTGSPS
jgi:4'-phosphopantetheinyl transferase EntD